MKKILFFIAIASFSTIGLTSCSEDDPVMEAPVPNPNPNVGEQLKITSSGTYIKEKNIYFVQLGSSATLSTTSGSKTISDAVYYVDGKKISGNTYAHSSIANVKIQAKRAGYTDSEFITVQFAQKPF